MPLTPFPSRSFASSSTSGPHFSVKGRVKRSRPCPVCEHTDWCSFSDCAGWLHCQRPGHDAPSDWVFVKETKSGGSLYKQAELVERERRPYVSTDLGEAPTSVESLPKAYFSTDLGVALPSSKRSPVKPEALRSAAEGGRWPQAMLSSQAGSSAERGVSVELGVSSTALGAGRGVPPPSRPGASPAVLHAIYSDLLAALSLNHRHTQELTSPSGARRLSREQVAALGAKSLPANDIPLCRDLAAKHGAATLLLVPGFYRNREGELRLNARQGLLLPSGDGQRLSGLRVRPDVPGKDGPKYFWLSSASKGGPRAVVRASLHRPLGDNRALPLPEQTSGMMSVPPSTGRVGVTEGEFKACIAAERLGYPFLSVPGIGAWASAGAVELARQVAGPDGLVTIFYDSEANPNTACQKHALAEALAAAGLRVELAEWTREHKGIDDLLLAGGTFRTVAHWPGLPGTPVDRVLRERYLPDLPLRKKVTLIRSPKGSGKSELMSRLIGRLPEEASVLAIGHRVALLEELSRRWSLDLYLDHICRLDAAQRLAVCADSLVRFRQAAPRDLVVIDEVEQVLTHFTGQTIKRCRQSCWATFQALLRSGRQIVALDADLGPLTYRFFAELVGPEQIEVIVNDHPTPQAAPILAYEGKTGKTDLTAALLERLAAGVPCYVATNSREEALTLERLVGQRFPERRVLCITQENSGDPFIRRLLRDLNRSAPAYDCLIASPTIGSGIDLSVEHFQETFVSGLRGSTTHTELLQQMARNRRARVIHAYIVPGERDEPTEVAYWQAYCLEKARETGLIIGYDGLGERIAAPEERGYLALWSQVQAATKASQNRLAEQFYAQAQAEGHLVSAAHPLPTAPPSPEQAATRAAITHERREVRQHRADERIAAILDAPDLSESEAWRLENQWYKTPQEQAAEERSRIARFYGLPVEHALVQLDDRGRLMSQLTAFMGYFGSLDPIEADRKRLEDPEALLPDARHETLKYLRRVDLFAAAELDDGEFTAAQLQERGFVAWALSNRERLYRDLGLRLKRNFAACPVALLSAALGQLGLRLTCRKLGKRGAQALLYHLDQARVTRMEALAQARAARLAAEAARTERESWSAERVAGGGGPSW